MVHPRLTPVLLQDYTPPSPTYCCTRVESIRFWDALYINSKRVASQCTRSPLHKIVNKYLSIISVIKRLSSPFRSECCLLLKLHFCSENGNHKESSVHSSLFLICRVPPFSKKVHRLQTRVEQILFNNKTKKPHRNHKPKNFPKILTIWREKTKQTLASPEK